MTTIASNPIQQKPNIPKPPKKPEQRNESTKPIESPQKGQDSIAQKEAYKEY